MTPTSKKWESANVGVTICYRQVRNGGSTRDSGGIMTLFVMATVGFVGMAIALLNDGSDMNFRGRQLAGAYRQR